MEFCRVLSGTLWCFNAKCVTHRLERWTPTYHKPQKHAAVTSDIYKLQSFFHPFPLKHQPSEDPTSPPICCRAFKTLDGATGHGSLSRSLGAGATGRLDVPPMAQRLLQPSGEIDRTKTSWKHLPSNTTLQFISCPCYKDRNLQSIATLTASSRSYGPHQLSRCLQLRERSASSNAPENIDHQRATVRKISEMKASPITF